MTKLKNTKKGMAKKALSISLVAAMLATSNVPVWAAEDLFSDGSAAVQSEDVESIDTFTSSEEISNEAPIVRAAISSLTMESAGITGNTIKYNADDIAFNSTVLTDDTNDYSLNWYITDSALELSVGDSYVSDGQLDYKNFSGEAVGTPVTATEALSDAAQIGKYITCVLYKTTKGGDAWTVDATSSSYQIVGADKTDYVELQSFNDSWGKKLPTITPVLKNDAVVTEASWYRDGRPVDASTYETTQNDINASFEYKATLTNTPFAGEQVTLATLSVTGKAVGNVSTISWSGFNTPVANGGILTCDYDGTARQLTIDHVTTKDGDNISDIKVQYTYERDNQVTTDFTSAGIIKVTAKVIEDGSLASGTELVVNLKINGIDISKNNAATVNVNPLVFNANGKYLDFSGKTGDDLAEAIAAAGLVVEKDGKTLEYGKDYTVSTSVPKNEAGTEKATVTVTGKGNYAGTVTKKMDIAAADLKDATVTDISAQSYTGNAIKPAVTVKMGTTALVLDKDYTVDYSNNVNVGKDALVIIKGKGNYTGEISKTFEIKSISLSLLKAEITKDADWKGGKFVYTGSAIEPVKDSYGYNGVNAVWMKGRDFEVKYVPQNTNAGDVKAVITGINNYAGQTEELTFKIEQVSLRSSDIKVDLSGITYSPDLANRKDEIKAGLKITYKDVVLVENFDYTVSSNITISGKKVGLTLTGNKNFKDTITVYADVKSKDINEITLPKIEAQKYTGHPMTPVFNSNGTLKLVSNGVTLADNIALKDGNVTLTGADYYIVNVTNNTKVGTATINLGGKGNYTGKVSISFPIVDQELTGTIVDGTTQSTLLKDQSYSYAKASTIKGIQYNGFKVMDASGADITTKCNITYTDNKAVGTATITATGKDGFEFNAVNTFKITPMALNALNPSLTIATASFDYTGEEIKPEFKFTAKDGSYTLVEGTDYKVEYLNNINAATATNSDTSKRPTVKITGLGNYAGKGSDGKDVAITQAFTINAVALSSTDIVAKDVAYAGGVPVKPEIVITNSKSSKALVEGTDYKVEITKGGTNVGPAEAKIVLTDLGKQNYTLSSAIETVRFNVTALDLSKATISPIEDQVVTGEQIKPAVVVMNGGVRLVETVDFEVSYGENKEIGEGTVTIKALSTNKNYTGSQTVKFNIVKTAKDKVGQAMIENVKVIGNRANIILDGHAQNAGGYDFVVATEEDYANGRVAISKNILATQTNVTYLDEGTYYAYCHAWKRGEDGKKVFGPWSNLYKFEIAATTPDTPVVKSVKVSGSKVTVTYSKCADATGYDVILGSSVKTVNGEKRPVNYGKLVKKVTKGNTVTATFTNVPKGTYYAGLHAYNRTSENNTKVFSKWSNTKKITVK